jgi:hypothetical protein
MINSEKNTLGSGIRFRELETALNFINNSLQNEYIGGAPFKIPNFINMLKNIKNKVDLGLELSISIIAPVPELVFQTTIHFTFAQIIEFIKQHLAEFVVDILLSSADAELYLINFEKEALEYIIRPFQLPTAIVSQINILNKKFDYARNLFKGYITIGIMESTSFLEKIISAPNTNYSYTIPIPLA